MNEEEPLSTCHLVVKDSSERRFFGQIYTNSVTMESNKLVSYEGVTLWKVVTLNFK